MNVILFMLMVASNFTLQKLKVMRKIITLFLSVLFASGLLSAQTNTFPTTGSAGIGTLTPNASSIMEMVSTTKGLLIPRMTTAQRNAIVTPATGLIIYQTDGTKGLYNYTGTAWAAVNSSPNKTLSNLTAPTAISQSLLPGVTNSIDVGSINKQWKDIYAGGNVNGNGFIKAGGTSGQYLMADGSVSTGPLLSNYMDLTTNQTAAGVKTFSNDLLVNGINVGRGNGSIPDNTAMGYLALQSNTTGSSNVANGYQALISNTTGNDNVANGAYALYFNTAGIGNVANGYYTLFNNTTGNGNVANGFYALSQNTTGIYNVANGIQALLNNTTGINNTGLGYLANVASGNLTNATAIGARAFVAKSNSLVLGSIAGINGADSGVNVGIGTSSPVAKLDVIGKIQSSDSINGKAFVKTGGTAAQYLMADGSISNGPSLTNYMNLTTNQTAAGVKTFSSDAVFNGNVGIGTTTPTSKFNVNGQVTIDQKNFGGYGGLLIKGGDAHSGNYPSIGFSLVNSAGNDVPLGYIQGVPTSIIVGQEAMDLGFYTSRNINSLTLPKMYIKENGKIGIGTSSPVGLLDVVSSANVETHAFIRNTGTNNAGLELRGNAANSLQYIDFQDGATSATSPDFRNRIISSTNNLTFATNTVGNAMVLLNNGNVGIGTNTPANKLNVFGSSSGATFHPQTLLGMENATSHYLSLITANNSETGILFGNVTSNSDGGITYRAANASPDPNAMYFRAANGTKMAIYNNGNAWLAGSLQQTSDQRLKTNIKPLQSSMQKLQQLNGYTYNWKDKTKDNDEQIGLIAQEVQKVFPQLVKPNPNGDLSVNYIGLIPVLLEGIKEQQSKMIVKEEIVQSLQAEMATVKMQMNVKDKTISKQLQQIEQLQSQVSSIIQTLSTMKYAQEACCNTAQAKSIKQNEIVENVEVPVLEQNAPNPVSNTTVIKYKLPSWVKEAQLIITDAKGRNLKVINLNGKLKGQVTLSSGTLAPGTYFYSLVTNGKKADTKQMQIIR